MARRAIEYLYKTISTFKYGSVPL